MKQLAILSVFFFLSGFPNSIHGIDNSIASSFYGKSEKHIAKELDYPAELADSGGAWVRMSINYVADLKAVLFLSENVGFVVGFKPDDWYSLILRTTDGGINWTRYNISTRVNINSIARLDSTTLVAAGGGWNGVAFESVIFKTTDLGTTWIKNSLTEVRAFNAVSFHQNGNGVLVGEQDIIYTTTNSGEVWTKKHLGILWSDELTDVCFLDSAHIVAVGNGGKILVSTDLGNNWSVTNSNTTKSLYAIKNVGGNLYVAGETGLIIFSDDSASSWQTQERVTTANLFGISFTSLNKLYIAGGTNNMLLNTNVILNTTNAGVNWYKQSLSPNFVLRDISFINEFVGFAVGDSGLVLKTTNGGVTFIGNVNGVIQSNGYLLSQNYPNPFNPSTKIKYAISSPQYATLKVYDVLGNEVATLVDEYKPAGSYEVEFNASSGIGNLASGIGYASGVYFYQLKAGEFVETKKMMLLR